MTTLFSWNYARDVENYRRYMCHMTENKSFFILQCASILYLKKLQLGYNLLEIELLLRTFECQMQ
jgi:hypothetical protein